MSRIGRWGGVRGGSEFFGPPPGGPPSAPPSKNLLGHFYEIVNTSSKPLAQAQSIGTLFGQIGVRGGSVDMSNSLRQTRLGAGRGVSQANGAAIHSKLPKLCQHEIVNRIMRKWKQCGTVQASCGCLVGHLCTSVRI